jgi:hypothetical protein
VGSFLISAPSDEDIPFLKIDLLKSGNDTEKYDVPHPIFVSVLSSVSAPPPPRIKIARFGDSGEFISVVFSGATNRPFGNKAVDNFNCSILFDFPGKFLPQSFCAWGSPTTVLIYPGYPLIYLIIACRTSVTINITITDIIYIGSLGIVIPGNTLKLLAKTDLTADCTGFRGLCNPAESQSIPILAPVNPLLPIVLATVPRIISNCSNLVIDASLSTGSGGRGWANITFQLRKNGVRDRALEKKRFSIQSIDSPITVILIYTYIVFTI